jgi:hypothetical protein
MISLRQTLLAAVGAFGVFAATSLVACGGGITQVPYTLQPQSVADPVNQAGTLIVANVTPGCIARPQFNETLLVVNYVCSGVAGNSVMRFDKVVSITIEKSGEWYRVLVRHRDGAADFTWSSKSLEDIEHLADALSALSRRASTGDGSAKPASSI